VVVLEIFSLCVLELFSGCPGDICSLSWRYLIGVQEIILFGVLEIFDQRPLNIWWVS